MARKSVLLALFTMMPLAVVEALILALTTDTEMQLGAIWCYMMLYGYVLALSLPDSLYDPPKENTSNLVRCQAGSDSIWLY